MPHVGARHAVPLHNGPGRRAGGAQGAPPAGGEHTPHPGDDHYRVGRQGCFRTPIPIRGRGRVRMGRAQLLSLTEGEAGRGWRLRPATLSLLLSLEAYHYPHRARGTDREEVRGKRRAGLTLRQRECGGRFGVRRLAAAFKAGAQLPHSIRHVPPPGDVWVMLSPRRGRGVRQQSCHPNEKRSYPQHPASSPLMAQPSRQVGKTCPRWQADRSWRCRLSAWSTGSRGGRACGRTSCAP